MVLKRCANCGIEFYSKSKISKVCTKKCKNALWYKNNSTKNKADAKRWRDNNKDYKRSLVKKYRATQEFKDKARIKRAEKLKKNLNFRLACNLRSRVSKVISGKDKICSISNSLGCTLEHLRAHLENKFYCNTITGASMTWENYGKWHIDHIVPLSSFNLSDPEQLKKACHYSNLQPLWAVDNMRKSDKIV